MVSFPPKPASCRAGKRIATLLVMMLASCTGRSDAPDRERGGSQTPATPLVAEADWGRLDPFYVFHCATSLDTEAGHFEFLRTYSPDGSLSDVHAMWDTPMGAMPSIQAVFNSENGRDFDPANGFVLVQWELIPALRPATIRSRLSIGDLPFAPDPHRPPVPGMISTLAGNNSVAMAALGWRDLTGAARGGVVTVRLDVTGAPAGWKNRLYPGYLTGFTTVGHDSLSWSIGAAALAAVEHRLQLMAAQTNVPRREDVPRRCVKTDQVSVEN